MRIQNISAVRDGVVFIGLETAGAFVPYGTGFLVSMPIDKKRRVKCVVTAAHVVALVPGETVYVRLNRKTGEAASVPVNSKNIIGWDKNDIAVIFLSITSEFDYKFLSLDETQLAKAREVFQRISFGDEVYAIGLYTSHYGLTRNVPVVRIGHVALLPGEPVRGPGGYVSAYLVEKLSR